MGLWFGDYGLVAVVAAVVVVNFNGSEKKNEKRVVVEEVAVAYGRENWGNYKLIMLIFNFILNWLILFLIHPMCKIRNLQTINY